MGSWFEQRSSGATLMEESAETGDGLGRTSSLRL